MNIRPEHFRFRHVCSPYRHPDQGKGTWSCTKVEIFDKEQDDAKIGEYIRSYASLGESTFYPFVWNGLWYALYSENYTEIAVMELPSCKKIASEKTGFCPTDFYVPYYLKYVSSLDSEISWLQSDCLFTNPTSEGIAAKEINCPKLGFAAGCYWGDDTDYDIVTINFANVERGEIEIVYPETPKLSTNTWQTPPLHIPHKVEMLQDCINLSDDATYEEGKTPSLDSIHYIEILSNYYNVDNLLHPPRS